MSSLRRDDLTLRTLAAMPFLDRLELAAAAGLGERTAHNSLAALHGEGLVEFVRHAAPLTATTRRWRLTEHGWRRLARRQGIGLRQILDRYPASAHWHRLLLERLDAVAVIYRLASALAAAADSDTPLQFQWYRADPLDAGVALPGGKTLSIIRWGRTADRAAFADRIGRLTDHERLNPRALLALLPDEPRLRQARRLLARYPGPVHLALEADAARAWAGDGIWRSANIDTTLTLRRVLDRLAPGGVLPVEPPRSRLSLPGPVTIRGDASLPDHLLPLALGPAAKRLLDCLSDWPWINADDLGGLLGLSTSGVSRVLAPLKNLDLVSETPLDGRRRLALSRRGLAFLARRDRASVTTAVRRWAVDHDNGAPPAHWRDVPGIRARPLARTIEHTQAVHRFMADLVRQTDANPGFQAIQVSPPHHSTRYFPHRGRLRSIHPDAFGVVRSGDKTFPFFLEWERRAVHPSTMAARIAPYLRYYSTNRPLDDHGHRPLVLVVFDDFIAEGNFLGVARSEMERAGVDVPLWVSFRERLERVGPLGTAWRSPDALEPSCAFQ